MPALNIDIEARYAKFQDALTSIERQTKKTAANIGRELGSVGPAIAGLAGAAAVGTIAALVKQAIDAADHLNDLSQQTGVAIEKLGGIGFAAGQAGGNLESVADAVGKLNKSIAGAAGGNKEFAEGFEVLGINIRDAVGKLKSADVVLAEIADKFEGYADGPEKVAIAVRLLGKAGAEQIALLNDGGDALRENIAYYERFSGATSKTGKEADTFNDVMGKLSLITHSFGNALARDVLPVLNVVSAEILGAAEHAEKFSLAGEILRTVLETFIVVGSEVAYTFEQVGKEIGGTASQLAALATLDFKGFSAIGDAMAADQEKALKDHDAFLKKVLDRTAVAKANLSPAAEEKGTKPAAPLLRSGQAEKRGKIIDVEFKEFERQYENEQRLLASRADFLQNYYQQDLLSINDYYDARRAAQAEALRNQQELLDKEIALVTARKPKDASGAADQANKINDLVNKRAALTQKAGEDGIKLQLDQNRAAAAFQDTLAGINAELLEQRGLLPQAAAIRFDQANKGISQKLETERDAAAARKDGAAVAALNADIARLETLRNLSIATARLNGLTEVGSRVQEELSQVTQRAQLAAKDGTITELESLREVSDARLQAAADLQQVADAYSKVAEAAGDPRLVAQARALQLEVDKLAASADLVREKFEEAFTGSFETALEKLISGTASLKDVVKGLFSDITTDISRIISKNLTEQLFSKNGSLGGLVDFASGLFGGKPGSASPSAGVAGAIGAVAGGGADAAAATAAATALTTLAATSATVDAAMLTLGATVPITDAGLVALGTSSIVVDAAFATLASSAAVAAAALASVSASSSGQAAGGLLAAFASAKGNIFAGGAVVPFAKGGMPGVVSEPTFFPMKGGRTGLMGEAGPEAIMPLIRDRAGRLSITMLGADGSKTLLPVTRDGLGRMAVRAQAFAKGGIIQSGSVADAAGRVLGMGGDMAQQTAQGKGDTHIHVNVTPPPGMSAATAQQLGATMGRSIANANRRNG